MDMNSINWDEVPDILNKEQFFKLCHISKATARYLLTSEKVPCEDSGKLTRKYAIKKEDVKDYLKKREIYPDYYSPAASRYPHSIYSSESIRMISIEEDMRDFYIMRLSDLPDVLTPKKICKLTGYQTHTIGRRYSKGLLKGFLKNSTLHIPKTYLIEFFNSVYFKKITAKSKWHKRILHEFVAYNNAEKKFQKTLDEH